MCPTTDHPTSCEIRAVIHFLHAKNISAAESIMNYAQFMAKT
jgi:hypothetical protein